MRTKFYLLLRLRFLDCFFVTRRDFTAVACFWAFSMSASTTMGQFPLSRRARGFMSAADTLGLFFC